MPSCARTCQRAGTGPSATARKRACSTRFRLHLTGEFWSYQRLKLAGVPSATAFGGYNQRGYFFVILRQPHPFVAGPEWDGGEDWDGGAHWG